MLLHITETIIIKYNISDMLRTVTAFQIIISHFAAEVYATHRAYSNEIH